MAARGGADGEPARRAKADDAISFVADACAALADAVNEIRVSTFGEHDLEATYAETVVAYSRLVPSTLSPDQERVLRAVTVRRLGIGDRLAKT